MKDFFYAIGLILIGVIGLYYAYKSRKSEKPTFTMSYILQVGGVFGYALFILIGISLLMKTLGVDWVF